MGFTTAPALADSTWKVNTSGSWSTSGNWTTGVPGSNTGTTSLDTATFGPTNTSGVTVTVDSNRNISGINFAGDVAAYNLSGGSLLLSSGGVLQTSGGGSAGVDAISSPITIEGNNGTYSFTAGSTIAGRTLLISGPVAGNSNGGGVTTLTLNGTNASASSSTGTNTIAGNISDGAGGGQLALIKSDAGTWALSGTNSFTGSVQINAGTLASTASTALNGQNVVSVNSGAMWSFAAASSTIPVTIAGLNDGASGGGTVFDASGGGRSLEIDGAGNYSFSGTSSGTTTTLIKIGSGTQTLKGATNFAAEVDSGALVLDFSGGTSPASNILSNGTTPGFLTLGGGALNLNGSASIANSQAIGRLTLNPGASSINLTSNGAAISLVMGNIQTRNIGSTLNLILPSSTQSTTNGILSTVANSSTTGIIGGYATVNGSDWAVAGSTSTATTYSNAVNAAYIFQGSLTNGSVVSFNGGTPSGSSFTGGQLYYVVSSTGTTYELAAAAGGTAITNATAHTSLSVNASTPGDITALAAGSYSAFVGTGGSSTGNYLLNNAGSVTSSQSFNTLKITTTSNGQSLNLGANTLTLTAGGLLFTGANNYIISNGSLNTNTASVTDLIFQQYGTGTLTVSANIVNGASGTPLVKSGTGALVLSGNNSYSGGTYLNQGILNINGFKALGSANNTTFSGNSLTFSGGTLQYAANYSASNSADISTGTTSFRAGGATIDTNGNNVSYANAIGGGGVGGLTKVGSGSLTLSAASTYSGGTTVSAGALLLNNGTSGSATGTGFLNVAAGGTIGGAGTSNSTTFAISGNVIVGNDVDTISSTTLTASSASTITNATLSFNLNNANSAQSNILNVGTTGITFSGTTLALNMVGASIVQANTPYELIAGTSASQYGGLTTFTNSLGQQEIEGSSALALSFEINGTSSNFYQPSYLFVTSNGDIDVEVVPEPGTWALMIGGLGLLIFLQKRRRNS